jgi:N-acetylglucosamine repressor
MLSKDFLKETNRSKILNVIKTHGAISRVDIARLTGLSPAGVTGITRQLIDDGLVWEKQEGNSRGGRRPILLALNSKGAYVVGLKLAPQHVTFALTDLNAEVILQRRVDMDMTNPVEVAEAITVEIQNMITAAHIDQRRVIGIGVAIPGITDADRGILRVSPFIKWHDIPFAELLESKIGYPVCIDNDVNTLALFERVYGYGQGIENFLLITTGQGIGMGIISNGRLHRGVFGGAGEFGHINIEPEGPPCTCGNRGCLETCIGDNWLVRRAALNGLNVQIAEDLVALAEGGNPVANDILAKAGSVLGRALAMLINLFNPELIVLSGEGIRARDFMSDAIHQAIQRYTFRPLDRDTKIRFETLSDDTWAHSASSLILSRLFNRPEISLNDIY